jgi:hypothetical protein
MHRLADGGVARVARRVACLGAVLSTLACDRAPVPSTARPAAPAPSGLARTAPAAAPTARLQSLPPVAASVAAAIPAVSGPPAPPGTTPVAGGAWDVQILVCVTDPSSLDLSSVGLFQLVNGAWVDITSWRDPSRRAVCGPAASLSTLALFATTAPALPDACAAAGSTSVALVPGPASSIAIPAGSLVTVQAAGGGGSGSRGAGAATAGGRGGYVAGTFPMVDGGTLVVEVGDGGAAQPGGAGNGGPGGTCDGGCGGAGGSSSRVGTGTEWLVEAGGGAGAAGVDGPAAPAADGGGFRFCSGPGGRSGAPAAGESGGGGGGWCAGDAGQGGSSHVSPSARGLVEVAGGGGRGGIGAEAGAPGAVVVCWAEGVHRLGGTVAGLRGAGLVLAGTGQPDLAVPAGASAFAFPNPLPSGTAYAVTVARQPSAPPQTCTVANGAGGVALGDVTDVAIACTPDVRVTVSPSTATVVAGASQTFTASVVGAPDAGVTWSVQEGDAGGRVSADGVYVAPDAPGTFHVVATSRADPTQGAAATVSVAPACWGLLAVNRVRFAPRPGAAQAMVGGTIQGSNDGPTNGFVTLATVTAAPVEGQLGELAFPNATPYRYVKYYGPPGSYGQIAELELYADGTRLSGQGFGTAGSRSGNAWPNALDGDPATFFDASTASDAYVGLDLAAGHVVEAPRFAPPPGAYPAPLAVAIATATPGAAVRWSADGGDPRTGGTAYAGPVAVRAGRTVLRAAATASCMHPSDVAIGPFDVGGGGSTSQASLHVGNSLTDTIDGFLLPLAVAGGVNLDYSRYTVPGIGTWVYQQEPANGFGVANVQTTVRTKRLDHISFQPFKNMPCLPSGAWTNPDAKLRSDAANIEDAWNDAVAVNPGVQMWVYQAWPATPTEGFTGCITGGAAEWLRDPAIWNPPPPATWDDAVRNQAAFDEAVRAALAARHPDRPPPYILPAGLALLALKQAVEAGTFPGLAATPSAFWTTFFSNNGTNNHLTNEGRWYVALVFYAAMFQRDPAGLPRAGTALTDAQAAALQALAWQTVGGYALSGIRR